MKIIILLLFPAWLFAQKKGDNTIVISRDISLSEIKTALFKSGYAVASADSLFISSSEKEIHKNSIVVRIMVARIDSVTYVKGQLKSSIILKLFGAESENNFEALDYRGMKGSPYRTAWDELDRVAKMINPEVSYIRQ